MYAVAEAGPGLGARRKKEGLPAMPGAPLSRHAYFVPLDGKTLASITPARGVAAWDWGEVVLE